MREPLWRQGGSFFTFTTRTRLPFIRKVYRILTLRRLPPGAAFHTMGSNNVPENGPLKKGMDVTNGSRLSAAFAKAAGMLRGLRDGAAPFFHRRAPILLCVAAAAAAVFCAGQAVQSRAQETAQQKTFSSLAGQTRRSAPGSCAQVWLSPYQDVFAQHRDMAAWLKIDGTALNYPVMQTPEDPDYYLHRDLDGQASKCGVPYLQCNCNLDTSSNLTVFGHSMKDGTMFAALLNYAARSYWQEHPEILLYTRTENRRYRIVGVFRESVAADAKNVFSYWNFVSAKSGGDYVRFMREVKTRSLYDTGVAALPGEQLLTLSTCEYTLRDGRLAVVAKRVA